VCDGSHVRVVLLKPLPLGHAKPDAVSAGIPGLASSQSKPSRPPEPVQCPPQETSFSPLTCTHFALRHWLSFEQKHPPGLVHWLDVPLQLPNGHENPVAAELGHPPSGHGTLASDCVVPPSSPPHTPPRQVWPAGHAAPQPPQLALSVW
jgi:hypothetical protein